MHNDWIPWLWFMLGWLIMTYPLKTGPSLAGAGGVSQCLVVWGNRLNSSLSHVLALRCHFWYGWGVFQSLHFCCPLEQKKYMYTADYISETYLSCFTFVVRLLTGIEDAATTNSRTRLILPCIQTVCMRCMFSEAKDVNVSLFFSLSLSCRTSSK